MTERAVFLDRDGVINRRSPWIFVDPRRLSLVDGAPEAAARLAEAGYRVVVVTNQPWVGYGVLAEHRLEAFHDELRERIRGAGGRVDAVYACTHRHREGCECRKPATGMLDRGREAFDLDPEACWMVGDKPSDVEAGRRFGARTAWVTGQRLPWERREPDPPADVTVEALPDAVDAILAAEGSGPG
jgi:histidinol-phosphate phosphatase family protein